MFTFNRNYFLLAIIIFTTEVLIALFVDDRLIRPFVGDALVVVLIYCFLRIFLNANYLKTAIGVLLFAFVIETLQYFDYVKLLGLENDLILSVALGRTFEFLDFIAYFAGFLLIIFIEIFYDRRNRSDTLKNQTRKIGAGN